MSTRLGSLPTVMICRRDRWPDEYIRNRHAKNDIPLYSSYEVWSGFVASAKCFADHYKRKHHRDEVSLVLFEWTTHLIYVDVNQRHVGDESSVIMNVA